MTGLRTVKMTAQMQRRINALKIETSANSFRPELERFAARTLATCIESTPVRELGLIERNQRKQYEHRINYIPSYHTIEDPSLIVNERDEEWIYAYGKWYRSDWNLKDEIWAAYQMLAQERARRMRTAESDFVNARAQARWLYRKSWWQVAMSLGLALSVAAAIIDSRTRKKPPKEPHRAYGQWRGGKTVLSVTVFNPFLDIPTKYWKGNGKNILAQATAKHRPRFIKECEDKMKRAISKARQTA